jgi:hypothetical protein
MTEILGIDFEPFISFTWQIAQIVSSGLFWIILIIGATFLAGMVAALAGKK